MTFSNQTLVFESDAAEPDALLVRQVQGAEAISTLFRFELELVSLDKQLDLEALLYAQARLGIKEDLPLPGGSRAKTTHWIAGELAEFGLLDEGPDYAVYRAVLVPRLHRLGESWRSRVFMGQPAPRIVARLLDEVGLGEGLDFELASSIKQALGEDPLTRGSYPPREYVVQYEESDLAFVNRWLEHEGIFFLWDFSDAQREKLLLCDSVSSYRPVRGKRELPYRPQFGPGSDAQDQGYDPSVASFRCELTRLPKEVVLNDYNWRTPDTSLRLSEPVRADSRAVHYEYNYHYKTPAQGQALAKVRAQELLSQARLYSGETDARNLRAGYTFDLVEHGREDFNRSYLLTRVEHTATQQLSLESRTVTGTNYRCRFQAIPADVPFRPAPRTEWPAIKGVIHAAIDGAGDGTYAELDAEGKYQVKIPFDIDGSGREPGKASRALRMCQPYAGSEEGMHFPLRQGTEVVLVHVDGDPDRPLIASAVPNVNTPSLVDQGNQTRNRIRTSSGNRLEFEDEEGREGIVMANNDGSAYFCFTKPGGMGSGSSGGTSGGDSDPNAAGSGGAVGASRPRGRVRAADPSSAASATGETLPGAGAGGNASDDTTRQNSGGLEFLAYDNVKQYDSAVRTGLNAVYMPNAVSPGTDNVIGSLDDVCSVFEAGVGKYGVVAGGPNIEVVLGDKGEYVKGSRNLSVSLCSTVEEKMDPQTTAASTLTTKLGKTTKWDTIKEEIEAKNVESTIGSLSGGIGTNWADKVKERVYAKEVSSETHCDGFTDTILARGAIHESKLASAAINSNEVAAIIMSTSTAPLHIELSNGIFIDNKFPMTIESVLGVRLQYENFSSEYDISNMDVRLDQIEIALGKTGAQLNQTVAGINDNNQSVADVELAVSKQFTRLNEIGTALNVTNTLLVDNKTALTTNNTALTDQQSSLQKSITSLSTKLGVP